MKIPKKVKKGNREYAFVSVVKDNMFLYENTKTKAKRIVEQYGEAELAPEKRLKEKDKRRAAYYQVNTDRKWGDIKNYDITLSTSSLGIERCADIIAELYKS